VKSVVDEMHRFYRQVDPLIDERMKLMASSPDTCPDDLLTAMLRIQPPVRPASGDALSIMLNEGTLG
jgi:hypothetical protein